MNGKEFLHRFTLRGLRKCNTCGHYNGIRAQSCKNKTCPLAVCKGKKKEINLDTVQLVSMTDSKLYSVQIREKNMENRSFVQITDKTISTDADGSIISRNAICYVDTCKYDSRDIHISCKHVKNALENTSTATVLNVNITIWYSMNLNEESKSRIWKLYSEYEHTTPIVQRISKNQFVVKCDTNVHFPAGRLHINWRENEKNESGKLICACNKHKIPDQSRSRLLENENCDHLFLLVAGILSSNDLKDEFKECGQLFNEMYTNTECILEENLLVTEDFIRFSEHILNDVELSNDDFSSNFITKDIDNFNHSMNSSDETIINKNSYELIEMPTFNNEKIIETPPEPMTMGIINNDMESELQKLELIDCKIEFMDELKLSQSLTNDIPSDVINTDCWSSHNVHNEILDKTSNDQSNGVHSKMKRNSMKLNKRKKLKIKTEDVYKMEDTVELDNLPFINWLESVIERINLTMDFNDDGNPDKLIFSVHNGFFEKLRNRFSIRSKQRLPNKTVIISDGQYKNLTMFSWIFTNLNVVQHIFMTENISLETERTFIETAKGVYTYVDYESNLSNIKDEYGNKPIEYKTFLKIVSMNETEFANDTFSIEWIPNVLKRSHFGEMRIKFTFGHMKDKTLKVINKTF